MKGMGMLQSGMAIILALAAAQGNGASAEKAMEPATNPGSWVTNDDYPASAMR